MDRQPFEAKGVGHVWCKKCLSWWYMECLLVIIYFIILTEKLNVRYNQSFDFQPFIAFVGVLLLAVVLELCTSEYVRLYFILIL